MAENKKSYVGYVDWGDTFDMLDDVDAGKLIKHFYAYIRDENPVLEDKLLQIAFHPIKLQLKRDLVKYVDAIEEKSISGRKGNLKRYHPEIYNRVIAGLISLEEGEELAKSRKVSHSEASDNKISQSVTKFAVNVTDNVTDNETDNVSVITPHAQKNIKKSFNQFPLSTDVGELTEMQIGTSCQLIQITKYIEVSKPRMSGMWEVFKVQNLTGKKYYAQRDDVFSHFINWIKTQSFSNPEVVEKKPKGESNLSAIVKQINESERLKNQANGK